MQPVPQTAVGMNRKRRKTTHHITLFLCSRQKWLSTSISVNAKTFPTVHVALIVLVRVTFPTLTYTLLLLISAAKLSFLKFHRNMKLAITQGLCMCCIPSFLTSLPDSLASCRSLFQCPVLYVRYEGFVSSLSLTLSYFSHML